MVITETDSVKTSQLQQLKKYNMDLLHSVIPMNKRTILKNKKYFEDIIILRSNNRFNSDQ